MQPRQPDLRELVLGLKQGPLRVEHGEQIVNAFAVADFRQPQRDSRLFRDKAYVLSA